jgi:carboxypeptidase Q
MRSMPALILLALTACAPGQTPQIDDPVIRRMMQAGIEQSKVEELAQILLDSIGPRLTGSPGLAAAQDWLVDRYTSWGITARKEHYGTWRGWRQGTLHVDLIAPRVQTLEAKYLAWSPGTDGPVEGEVVHLLDVAVGEPEEWLPKLAGKWVMLLPAVAMCRAPEEAEQYARPETVRRLAEVRDSAWGAFWALEDALGGYYGFRPLIDSSEALGFLQSWWVDGWGVDMVLDSWTRTKPSFDLSCEDYGMLARMVARGQRPRIRVDADAELLGEVPQFNVIAELRGTELPDEYVVLSAHLDSWHAATGATDNGTGTITMLEAMRILQQAYPNPRRTILVGHWGAEEMNLTGSRAFTEDHPELLDAIQVVLNQDQGTWRVEKIEGQGFAGAGRHVRRWMSIVPRQIAEHIVLDLPGPQENLGSDHVAFLCRGVPAFDLQSPVEEYRRYTRHTNRDTYDKIVFDDLKENATLAAILAYAASEDPERVPRDRAALPIDERTGEPREWVSCGSANRSY